jgi:hypothetical protein
MWQCATHDQKKQWNIRKAATFGQDLLNTRLIDIICSFGSRWIPQTHCTCPICYEEGKNNKFSTLSDFINHTKNVHKVGWKNVKDFWCIMCSRVLGRAVYREAVVPGNCTGIELMNTYAWCRYPKCKHSHEKGQSFLKHFDKEHKSQNVPSMGI